MAIHRLVGGLEHEFYFSIYWEEYSQLTFILFRGPFSGPVVSGKWSRCWPVDPRASIRQTSSLASCIYRYRIYWLAAIIKVVHFMWVNWNDFPFAYSIYVCFFIIFLDPASIHFKSQKIVGIPTHLFRYLENLGTYIPHLIWSYLYLGVQWRLLIVSPGGIALIHTCGDIWRFPEMGVPLNHPFIDGFPILNHSFWRSPIDGTPHIVYKP